MVYPIKLLRPHFLQSVVEEVPECVQYSNELVKKNFFVYDGPGKCNLKYTPLFRIFSFQSTTDKGEITGVLNDGSHKILVIFTRECIEKFELAYSRRLTYHTSRSLVIVRRANLRFIPVSKLRHTFGNVPQLRINTGLEVIYLEACELLCFQFDQVTVADAFENSLKFIYEEKAYQEKYTRKDFKTSYKLADYLIRQLADGLISDDET